MCLCGIIYLDLLSGSRHQTSTFWETTQRFSKYKNDTWWMQPSNDRDDTTFVKSDTHWIKKTKCGLGFSPTWTSLLRLQMLMIQKKRMIFYGNQDMLEPLSYLCMVLFFLLAFILSFKFFHFILFYHFECSLNSIPYK